VRQESKFLVGGIGETADGRPRLFVGEVRNGQLIARGTVELGVGRRLVEEIVTRARRRRTSPFDGVRSRRVVWLEPTVEVAVSYGRAMDGWLREPACRGLATTTAGIQQTTSGHSHGG
jgi:hypothetical protein